MLKALRKAGVSQTEPKDQTRKYGTIEQITDHHLKRYEFAITRIPKGARVLDAACGCGYGSWLMQQAGLEVTGVDISGEAISYAEENYKGPSYIEKSVYELDGTWDAIVSFETLEHLVRPLDFLEAVKAPLLIASVPNENVYPFHPEVFKDDLYPHQRHYTAEQFTDLLNAAGYAVAEKFSQPSKIDCSLVPNTKGMFLVYVAK